VAARLPATALVALALAGCGAEENAREVVDPVAEAADRTVAAGGARIDGAALFQVQGQEVEATIRGIVDFDDERSRIRMRFPGLSAQE
jgi:hypothetical protein